jgi:subtilisin family serine protease
LRSGKDNVFKFEKLNVRSFAMKKGNKGWIGKRAVWAGLLALLAPLWASGQGLAPVDWDGLVLDGEKPTAVADELIVIYKEGAVRPAAGPKAPGTPPPFFGKLAWQQPMSAPASHAAAGAVEVFPFGRIHGEQVRLAAGGGVAAMRAAAAKYEENPDVLCAEPNYMFYTRKAPDDTFYNIITNGLLQLWGMKAIGAEEAWNITTGSLDIVVAVIDTGIGNELGGYPIDPRNSHPDLAANMWRNTAETGLYYTDFHELADRETDGIDNSGNGHIDDWRGWNAVSWNNWPRDGNDHGTHCAGTIGGVGDNQTGVAGVGEPGGREGVERRRRRRLGDAVARGGVCVVV